MQQTVRHLAFLEGGVRVDADGERGLPGSGAGPVWFFLAGCRVPYLGGGTLAALLGAGRGGWADGCWLEEREKAGQPAAGWLAALVRVRAHVFVIEFSFTSHIVLCCMRIK